MSRQHKTIKEWQETLRGRVSPRLANQELFDMLWEDLPHIFAEFAKLETARERTAKEIEQLEKDIERIGRNTDREVNRLRDEVNERDADILAHSDKYQALAAEFDAQSEEIFRLKKTIGGNCPVTDTDQRCHIVDLLAEERDTAEKDLAAVRDAHELPPIPCGLVVNEYARKAGAWERVRTVLDEKGDK